jgi:four helix bundle protein
MDLVESCYHITQKFPRNEEFVLGAQLRRAAISVPSNIAEGQRLSTNAFRSYLRTALGSEAEIETQLELAVRLKFVASSEASAALSQAEEVARLVRGLIASLPRV